MISDLIKKMTAAGAPMEAVMIAIEAIEAVTRASDHRDVTRREEEAARREASRKSSKKYRENNDHVTSPSDHRDNHVENAQTSILTRDTEESIDKGRTEDPRVEVTREGVPPARAKRVRSTGTRLPADWKPTIDEIAFAREHLAASVVPNEVLKFRNYWVARTGAGATKMDWHRTFQNWCISAAERGPKNRPQSSTNRSWKDERAERNYRASEALNKFVFGDSADDQAAGGPIGDENAGVVLDLEPAQPGGLHAAARGDADEISFFDRRSWMRGGSKG